MKYDDFFYLCKNRRSIRKYIDKSVPQDIINQIIEAGIQAPSGTNMQGWKFRIIINKNEITKLADIIQGKLIELANRIEIDGVLKENILHYGKNFYFFKNAPVIILLYSAIPRSIMKRFFDSDIDQYKGEGSLLSLGMVIQNMMLAASCLNIATCTLTGPLLAEKEINSIFQPPVRFELGSILCMGYSEETSKSPGRFPIEKFIIK